ncbi:microcin C ABC transporter permease YejB [Pararhodospirillum photometricum]|nr:microcin C ABC transporter permease YejB [Pararhodospirillum photometricum]
MSAYLLRRLLLIPVTLFGIILVNFVIVQFAPGGPIEQVMAEMRGTAGSATGRFSGEAQGEAIGPVRSDPTRGGESLYRGARGLDPAYIKRLEEQFHFDRPAPERFVRMVADYATFDLGESFFRGRPVLDLVLEKLPVSLSLGLWSTLIIYVVSIPLGIFKAVRDGSRFDILSSWAIIIGYAVPAFLFAVLLVVVFAGGQYLNWFPLQGLVSSDWHTLSWPERVIDYLWHMVLPVTAMVIGGFASLTLLTKNSFLDEIHKQYVVTARAKGLSEGKILRRHVFRNAMLLVIAGFPAALVSMLFTGSVLIEVIFSLDGLGLLGFESTMRRDYPVMFGTLYLFSLIGLVLALISDLTYHLVDPRIDFASRET